MAIASDAKTGKLICGIMYQDQALLKSAKARLCERFGDIESETLPFDFIFTHYYQQEMGQGLRKMFFSFKRPFDIAMLPDTKLYTNKLELELSQGTRKINIDPGYMTRDHLVVASAKSRPHRIYIEKGIYAHLMFIFKKNGVISFKWTFPDYLEKGNIEFFSKVRDTFD